MIHDRVAAQTNGPVEAQCSKRDVEAAMRRWWVREDPAHRKVRGGTDNLRRVKTDAEKVLQARSLCRSFETSSFRTRLLWPFQRAV